MAGCADMGNLKISDFLFRAACTAKIRRSRLILTGCQDIHQKIGLDKVNNARRHELPADLVTIHHRPPHKSGSA
jgi:hypothetical protein